MMKRALGVAVVGAMLGIVAVPAAHAFECPILHKEARQVITKARKAAPQVTDPVKLAAIDELLDTAEEKQAQSERTHYGANNTADHASSVRLGHEAIGLGKEAYYLATK